MGHKDSVYGFAIDNESQTIYSAGADGYIVAWEKSDYANGILVLQTSEAFYSVHYEPQLQLLFAGTRSGSLYVVDVVKKQLMVQLQLTNVSIFFTKLAFHKLWIGTESGELIQLDLDFNIVQKSKLSSKSLRVMTISPNEDKMYIGCSDFCIYGVTKDGVVINTLQNHTNSVFGLACWEEALWSAARDAMIKKWDTKNNIVEKEVAAHLYQITSLAANDTFLISTSMDKSIKIWSHDLQLLKVLNFEKSKGHTNCINKVLWLSTNRFVTSSDDRTLKVWEIEINP